MNRDSPPTPPPFATNFWKVYATLAGSSLLFAPLHARWLFLFMGSQADSQGIVRASRSGLAHQANLTEEQCDDALNFLLSADPKSRSPEHEGRRIEEVPGGWRLIQYLKYRDLRSPTQENERKRKAAYRAKQRKVRR